MESDVDDDLEDDTPNTNTSNSNESGNASSIVSSDDEFPKITDGVHEFAEWIFGPKGIKSTQVVVVGDFSYNGRYEDTNVRLCRSSGATAQSQTKGVSGDFYRHVTSSDRMLWGLLDKYSNVLEACPTDSILEQ